MEKTGRIFHETFHFIVLVYYITYNLGIPWQKILSIYPAMETMKSYHNVFICTSLFADSYVIIPVWLDIIWVNLHLLIKYFENI